MTSHANTYPLVVVSNRLPVDSQIGADGTVTWVRSPGGLVTALESVMRDTTAAWVGWPGSADLEVEPFDADGMHLVPVPITGEDFEHFYEGFSNATIWPLYHDVIAVPEFHREWWERYVAVNERFAAAVATVAAEGATVWVQDYQLQLVPRMLRQLRPDLAIGFFLHIPFPPYGLFSQLPWRARIVDGLLGADVVGFQRASDAANFATAVRRLSGAVVRAQRRGSQVEVLDGEGRRRTVDVRAFPISIDAAALDALARTPAVQARAREIRESLGAHRTLFLGVDRLDYTKGIVHRLKAYGELLEDGLIHVDDAALIQIAVPSRERVAAYVQLRDEVELMAGRINGDHQTLSHRAISYHYHAYPREEMAAMFLAADVLLVTALRDGMNLVAKEYVASRFDEDGVLILSEFTGAADELRRAVLVNPHDIEGLKNAMIEAMRMPKAQRRARMRAMRRRVAEYDVARWSSDFLEALSNAATASLAGQEPLPAALDDALEALARAPRLLVALDFDGTLSPEVDDPLEARALPEARDAVIRLSELPDTRVALVSGRSIEALEAVTERLPESIFLVGSHGAELRLGAGMEFSPLGADEEADLTRLGAALDAVVEGHDGVWLERKPAGFALHTRLATQETSRIARLVALEALERSMARERIVVRHGRTTLEFAVRGSTKGDSIDHLRRVTAADAVFFAGDDVTDEDAFAALLPADVGLKSGPGATVADHRVSGPVEVALALHRLADLREAHRAE